MPQPALFLDRDGVINRDLGYVCTTGRFEFIPGIFDCVRRFRENGHLVIVVTNQSGIGRGIFTLEQHLALDEWMHAQFTQRGVSLTRTYYCPHHVQAVLPQYKLDCPCRKPKPGMLLQAQRDLDVDLGRSALIGNMETDILAGLAAGVPANYLLWDSALGPAPVSKASAVVRELSAVPA